MKPGWYKQEAVVLSRFNYGEADLIVGLFTRDFGKVRGLARHGRKSRKRFGNVLDPGCLAEFSFTHTAGRDLVRLEGGDLIRAPGGLGEDVRLMGAAMLALELVDSFSQQHDADPALFELLIWCLDRLSQNRLPREAGFIFQLRLLLGAGFGPNLEGCGVCGRTDFSDREAVLAVEHGGLACRGCVSGGYPVDPAAVKVMALARSVDFKDLDRVRVGPKTMDQAGAFLLTYLKHHLGPRP